MDELPGARRALMGWQLDLRITGRLSESKLGPQHSPGRSDSFDPVLFESQVLWRSDVRALVAVTSVRLITIDVENLVDPFFDMDSRGRFDGILRVQSWCLLHIVVFQRMDVTELSERKKL